jgi:hypothetical protein
MVVLFGVIPVFHVCYQDNCAASHIGDDGWCVETAWFETEEEAERFLNLLEDDELVSYGQMPEDDAEFPF